MEKKVVVSLTALRYEKMYKIFYSNPNNQKLALDVFFKKDVINKAKLG